MALRRWYGGFECSVQSQDQSASLALSILGATVEAVTEGGCGVAKVPVAFGNRFDVTLSDATGICDTLSISLRRTRTTGAMEMPDATWPAWLVSETDDSARLSVNGFEVSVAANPFWRLFAGGWEPETFGFYARHVRPGSMVLDIGSWIGPTALLAVSLGASRVHMFEPNPLTLDQLAATRAMDDQLREAWVVHPHGVGNEVGSFSFGTPTGKQKASSASSLSGTGTVVEIKRLDAVLESICGPGERDLALVKIDIEGAETLIYRQLHEARLDAPVLLSLHPPMWGKGANLDDLAALLEGHLVTGPDGTPLSPGVVLERVTSTDPNPPWGSDHGNFFEIALHPGGVGTAAA
ncbi:MAG: FkbM family methyltransferase [Pseudomonadota bacterium]